MSVLVTVAALSFGSLDRELGFYDAGVYVVTAKAIATGVGYRNANLPGVEPQGKYPPGVPYMLAAVWRMYPTFPDNLMIMRSGVIICSLLFLLVTWGFLVRAGKLTPWKATGVVTLVALNPVFLDFAKEVSGEIPYALGCGVALYGYTRFLESGRGRWLGATLAGVAIAVLTRSMAIAMIVGIVADALFRGRRRVAIMVAAAGAALAAPWSVWAWHTETAYSGFPSQIAANYYNYAAHLAATERLRQFPVLVRVNVVQFLFNWSSYIVPWLPGVAGVILVLFLMHAVRARILKERQPHDLYCVVASALIVLWPWPLNSRFVLVLSPFLIAYCLEGLEEILEHVGERQNCPSIGSVVLAVMFTSAIAFDVAQLIASIQLRPVQTTAYQQFHEMTEWIRLNTKPDAVFVTASDPMYYLFADRKTVRLAYPDPFAVYYDPVHPARFSQPETVLAWFRKMKSCYFIKDPLLGQAEFGFYSELIDSLQHASSGSMVRLHASPDGSFELLRLARCEQ